MVSLPVESCELTLPCTLEYGKSGVRSAQFNKLLFVDFLSNRGPGCLMKASPSLPPLSPISFVIFPPNQLNRRRRRPKNRGRVEWGSCCCWLCSPLPHVCAYSCMIWRRTSVLDGVSVLQNNARTSLLLMKLGKKCAMTGRKCE